MLFILIIDLKIIISKYWLPVSSALKTNFKKIKSDSYTDEVTKEFKPELTPEEFEEYVVNSGAKGSFMIYRSKNKDEELGLDEL